MRRSARPCPSPLVLVLLLAASVARASTGGAPLTMVHSGYLLDAADHAPTTIVSMKFRLYDAVQAGKLEWEGSCPSIAVANGYYRALLGGEGCTGNPTSSHDPAVTLDPVLDTSDLPISAARWLEAEVDGVTLSPRMVFATVPTAAVASRALDADKLGNHPASDFAPALHSHVASDVADLAPVATTGSYADLADKPVLDLPSLTGGAAQMVGNDLVITGALKGASLTVGSTTVIDASGRFVGDIAPANTGVVPNLNAQLLENRRASDFALAADLANQEYLNRVANSSFEIADFGQPLPSRWDRQGAGAATIGLDATIAVFGAKALVIADSDTAGWSGMRQVLLADAAQLAPYVGGTFTASVYARRTAGTGAGRICVRESETNQHCAALNTGSAWAVTTVRHVIGATPQFLDVMVTPTTEAAETATWAFDGVMVTGGTQSLGWAASPADSVYSSQAAVVGVVSSYAGDAAPAGYLLCDGAEIPAATYPVLCSVLGAKFGVATAGFCKLPDLRSRFVQGHDADNVGDTGGSASAAHAHAVTSNVSLDAHAVTNAAATRNTDVGIANHTLAVGNLPAHDHAINHTHGASSVSGSVGGSDGAHTHIIYSPAGHTWNTSYSNGGLAATFSFAPSAVNASVGYGGQQLYAAANGGGHNSNHGHGFSLTAGGQTLTASSGTTGSGTALTHAITQPAFTSNVSVANHTVTNGSVSTGASSQSENRPPFLVMNYIIKF